MNKFRLTAALVAVFVTVSYVGLTFAAPAHAASRERLAAASAKCTIPGDPAPSPTSAIALWHRTGPNTGVVTTVGIGGADARTPAGQGIAWLRLVTADGTIVKDFGVEHAFHIIYDLNIPFTLSDDVALKYGTKNRPDRLYGENGQWCSVGVLVAPLKLQQ